MENIPGSESKYQPISTAGFIGIILLGCIPIVGFIILLVWAFGGCRKVNKRNYARASLILSVICLIFTVIIGIAIKNVITKVTEEVSAFESLINMENLESLEGLEGLEGMEDLEGFEGLEGLESLEGLENLEGLKNLDEQQLMDGLGVLSEITGDGSVDTNELTQIMSVVEEITGEDLESIDADSITNLLSELGVSIQEEEN